ADRRRTRLGVMCWKQIAALIEARLWLSPRLQKESSCRCSGLPPSQFIAADRDHPSATGGSQALRLFEAGQRGGVLAHEIKGVAFVVPCTGIAGTESNGSVKADNGCGALIHSQQCSAFDYSCVRVAM